MKITVYKTAVVREGDDLLSLLERYLPVLGERSIVVVTSKIVSMCHGHLVDRNDSIDKKKLIRDEADAFLDSKLSKYDITLTVKDGILIANSGIDESNGNGKFVLWPRDPFGVAATIWKHLRKKYIRTRLGVLITDTRTTPLRWGTIGVALAWCGFVPLKNYIGEPDIFGKKLRMTKASVVDGLAAAADLIMGQGNEQTPLALIEGVPFVEFHTRPQTKKEIQSMHIALEDDLFAPLLTAVRWNRG